MLRVRYMCTYMTHHHDRSLSHAQTAEILYQSYECPRIQYIEHRRKQASTCVVALNGFPVECEAHTKRRGSGKKKKVSVFACTEACEYCICTNSRCFPSSPLDGYRPVQDQTIPGSKAPSAFKPFIATCKKNAKNHKSIVRGSCFTSEKRAPLLRCKTSFTRADKER